MNTTVILALVALATTGLALIHEIRLRRAARNAASRLIQAIRHSSEVHDQARDGR